MIVQPVIFLLAIIANTLRGIVMKTLIIVSLLVLSSTAHSDVLCRKFIDYNYVTWFAGYTCPVGFMFVKSK